MTIEQLEALAFARRMVRLGLARELRIHADLSQEEVADACRASHSTISRWENNNRVPHGEAGVLYGELLRRLHAVRAEEAVGA